MGRGLVMGRGVEVRRALGAACSLSNPGAPGVLAVLFLVVRARRNELAAWRARAATFVSGRPIEER